MTDSLHTPQAVDIDAKDEELEEILSTYYVEYRSSNNGIELQNCLDKAISAIKSRDQQIALAAQIQVLEEIAKAYHDKPYIQQAREALSIKLFHKLDALRESQEKS